MPMSDFGVLGGYVAMIYYKRSSDVYKYISIL